MKDRGLDNIKVMWRFVIGLVTLTSEHLPWMLVKDLSTTSRSKPRSRWWETLGPRRMKMWQFVIGLDTQTSETCQAKLRPRCEIGDVMCGAPDQWSGSNVEDQMVIDSPLISKQVWSVRSWANQWSLIYHWTTNEGVKISFNGRVRNRWI